MSEHDDEHEYERERETARVVGAGAAVSLPPFADAPVRGRAGPAVPPPSPSGD
ncbi:hypothetical protein [Salinigranum rubrum]|uniref:hypothetical protein n=1 Tax=Salinigranum rubrum TaxID=755307 RepID=UPI0013A5B0E8|nr:hypothetical protein [Salinigranum rubrum]